MHGVYMESKKNYKFTNKKHPPRAIMSSILGTVSLVSLIIAIVETYLAGGSAGMNMGMVGFFATCFSAVGLVLGYLAKREADSFHFFSWLGIILNLLALIGISMILYAGAYGIGTG